MLVLTEPVPNLAMSVEKLLCDVGGFHNIQAYATSLHPDTVDARFCYKLTTYEHIRSLVATRQALSTNPLAFSPTLGVTAVDSLALRDACTMSVLFVNTGVAYMLQKLSKRDTVVCFLKPDWLTDFPYSNQDLAMEHTSDIVMTYSRNSLPETIAKKIKEQYYNQIMK